MPVRNGKYYIHHISDVKYETEVSDKEFNFQKIFKILISLQIIQQGFLPTMTIHGQADLHSYLHTLS